MWDRQVSYFACKIEPNRLKQSKTRRSAIPDSRSTVTGIGPRHGRHVSSKCLIVCANRTNCTLLCVPIGPTVLSKFKREVSDKVPTRQHPLVLARQHHQAADQPIPLNRILLVLFGMHNITLGPYSAAIPHPIGSSAPPQRVDFCAGLRRRFRRRRLTGA
jgi:hypothetical protein